MTNVRVNNARSQAEAKVFGDFHYFHRCRARWPIGSFWAGIWLVCSVPNRPHVLYQIKTDEWGRNRLKIQCATMPDIRMNTDVSGFLAAFLTAMKRGRERPRFMVLLAAAQGLVGTYPNRLATLSEALVALALVGEVVFRICQSIRPSWGLALTVLFLT